MCLVLYLLISFPFFEIKQQIFWQFFVRISKHRKRLRTWRKPHNFYDLELAMNFEKEDKICIFRHGLYWCQFSRFLSLAALECFGVFVLLKVNWTILETTREQSAHDEPRFVTELCLKVKHVFTSFSWDNIQSKLICQIRLIYTWFRPGLDLSASLFSSGLDLWFSPGSDLV